MKIFSSSTIVIAILLIIFSFYAWKKYSLLICHFFAIVFSGIVIGILELLNNAFNKNITIFLSGLAKKIFNKLEVQNCYIIMLIIIFVVVYIISYNFIKYFIKKSNPFFEKKGKQNIIYGILCGTFDFVTIGLCAVLFVFLIEPQSNLETGFLDFLKPTLERMASLL